MAAVDVEKVYLEQCTTVLKSCCKRSVLVNSGHFDAGEQQQGGPVCLDVSLEDEVLFPV